jgi:hypothetical protein
LLTLNDGKKILPRNLFAQTLFLSTPMGEGRKRVLAIITPDGGQRLEEILSGRRAEPIDKIEPQYHVPADHPGGNHGPRTFLSGEKPDTSTLP